MRTPFIKTFQNKINNSILVLTARRFIYQGIFTFSNIIILRLQSPETIGIFTIISFLIILFEIVTGLGLSQAIIQKKEAITKEEENIIFTALLLCSILFIFLLFFLLPFISEFYGDLKIGRNLFWFRIYILTIFFTSVSSISLALLEREMEYLKITIAEVVSLITLKTLIIYISWLGFEIESYAIGNVIGRVLFFLLLFHFKPYSIKPAFSLKILKKFIIFGFDAQFLTFLNFVNFAVNPVIIGRMVGVEAVAFLSYAQGLRLGSLAPNEVISRIAFSSFSKIQQNRSERRILLEKYFFLSSLFTFPLIAAVFVLAPYITSHIYTTKWLPALPALYIFLVEAILFSTGSVSYSYLMALGKISQVRNFSILNLVIQWILTIVFVYYYGFIGLAMATLLSSFIYIAVVFEIKKMENLEIFKNTFPFVLLSIFTALFLYFSSEIFLIDSLSKLILTGLCGAVFYFSLILLLYGKKIKGHQL